MSLPPLKPLGLPSRMSLSYDQESGGGRTGHSALCSVMSAPSVMTGSQRYAGKMIDLHCHYLPGVDDGAPDVSSGIALLRAAAGNGIQVAVLTPHIFPGRWNNTRASLEHKFNCFAEIAAESNIDIQIRLGAEVHLLPESLLLLEADQIPTLGYWGGRKVMLLEFPDGRIPIGAQSAVERLLRQDIVPMIAHPERNKQVMRAIRTVEPFVKAGCLLQLTAASVCGWFGKPAYEASIALLDAGWTTVLATDAHNLRHRPPVLAEARHAVRVRFGTEVAEALTYRNPLAIIRGSPQSHTTAAPLFRKP